MWTSLLKVDPLTHFVFSCKKQGCFFYFIPNLTPKQVWAQLFLENGHFQIPEIKIDPPFLPFSWKTAFRPLDTKRILRVILKKRPPFTCFLFTHVCNYTSEWPPGSGYASRQKDKREMAYLSSYLATNLHDLTSLMHHVLSPIMKRFADDLKGHWTIS